MNKYDFLMFQILVAMVVSAIIVIPISIYKHIKYRKEGKSVKSLALKLTLKIGLPIISIPILLSDVLSWPWKIGIITLMGLGGILYLTGIEDTRDVIRKILGLPPVDEHTGQVIKEETKKSEKKEDIGRE